MLVLTRRLSDTITIGNPLSDVPPLEVTVVEVEGENGRLGSIALRDMETYRPKIYG